MARDLGFKTPDEMFVDLGTGDLSVSRVIRELPAAEESGSLLTAAPSAPEARPTGDVNIVGLKGLLTTMGRCCNPTPGDQIIAYITRGRGATIHRQDCPNILRLRPRGPGAPGARGLGHTGTHIPGSGPHPRL